MSNRKNTNKLKKDNKSTIALIGSLVLITAIVTIALVSFYAGKREGEQISQIPIIDIREAGQHSVLGTQIYNWYGTILIKDNSAITFSINQPGNNNSQNQEQVIAKITPNTKMIKWDLSQPANPGQPDSNRQPISLAEVQPGQQIIVRANKNINDHNEIQATTISVLITPIVK